MHACNSWDSVGLTPNKVLHGHFVEIWGLTCLFNAQYLGILRILDFLLLVFWEGGRECNCKVQKKNVQLLVFGCCNSLKRGKNCPN